MRFLAIQMLVQRVALIFYLNKQAGYCEQITIHVIVLSPGMAQSAQCSASVDPPMPRG